MNERKSAIRLNPPGPVTMETTTSRRRSQRLFLQVQVLVEGKLANKSPFSEVTHTIVVNAHGALVEMSTSLDSGQIVSVQNVRTTEKIECNVKLVTAAGAGKFNAALEFVRPNAGFWRISFPPDDWAARYADIKKEA
jgi:hypothetical protein